MTHRFKGLDMIDRVPEELWTEVHDIVQEAVMKIISKKKKCKKANWLSSEALQIAVKRIEVIYMYSPSELLSHLPLHPM